jgi:NAD(P)-dependent dehydrogenase (short-subunit alcohol dehydrogenase family)
MNKLAGRVAFITGAGAGIAKQTAQLFANEGASVVIAEIDEDRGQASAEAITASGGRALFVPTDVTSEASVERAVLEGVNAFRRLDVLFNCAGGSSTDDSIITEVDIASVWKRTMEYNVLGTMLCCRHAIGHIKASGGGSVINMSSAAALRGASPYHVYTAAKGAILSLTRALAGTFAKDNIRVNAICSGRVQTERNIVKYGPDGMGGGQILDRQDAASRIKEYPFWLGEPQDIAGIALFLATDDSRLITGASIPADGGRSAY